MRNLGIKAFFLIWRKNTLNVDLREGGKLIYIYMYIHKALGCDGNSNGTEHENNMETWMMGFQGLWAR